MMLFSIQFPPRRSGVTLAATPLFGLTQQARKEAHTLALITKLQAQIDGESPGWDARTLGFVLAVSPSKHPEKPLAMIRVPVDKVASARQALLNKVPQLEVQEANALPAGDVMLRYSARGKATARSVESTLWVLLSSNDNLQF